MVGRPADPGPANGSDGDVSARLYAGAARHPLALVAVGVVLYSIGPVFVQASQLSGTEFSLWRLWLGFALLGAVALVHRRKVFPLSRGALGCMAGAGICFGLHQVLIMSALKRTSVADVVLMNTIGPIVVAVIAIPLFGERPGVRFRLWSVLAIAGAAIVAFGGAAGPGGDVLGIVMAATNVVFFAGFFLFSKVSRDSVAVVPFLAGSTLFAALLSSLVNVAVGTRISVPEWPDLWYVLVVVVGPGAIGHFAMTWPLRWVRANVPPVMRMTQPFIAGALAWAWLGEAVTALQVVGGAMTIAGVCAAVLSRSGREFAVDRTVAPNPPA